VEAPEVRRRPAGKKEAQAARRSDVTLMLRNIPNKYTQDVLLEELAMHLQSMDFFYLPIDFRNQCNLGYAFLNFKDGAAAQAFQATFDSNRLARFPQSPKVLQVHMARVQGLQANVKRLRNSTVMGMLTEDCKPVLFDGGEMKPLAHSQPQGVSRRARTRGQAR
jgi:RNA recognition motif-containing protein